MKNQKLFNDTLSNIRNDLVGISLNISSQELTDYDILPLTKALAKNHSLTSLFLSCNKICAKGATALAKNNNLTPAVPMQKKIGAGGVPGVAKKNHISSHVLYDYENGD